jgi:hypothetical protein
MKQEFITSRGKVIIERNVLYIRTLKFSLTDSIAARLFYSLIPLGLFFIQLFEPESAKRNMSLFIWGGLALLHIYPLFDLLFKRSIASRIPLERIRSFEVKADPSGLESNVILHLSNGRYRQICFRTLENQFEPFLEAIGQSVTTTQLA